MIHVFCKAHNIFSKFEHLMFLVPLVWFEFHIGPRVSVGNVAAVSVTCCCFPRCSCGPDAQPLNWRTSCTYGFIDNPNV